MQPRAYRIPQVCAITGIGRSSIYRSIKTGQLKVRKLGRSTIVLCADLDAFLTRLPDNSPDTPGASKRDPRRSRS